MYVFSGAFMAMNSWIKHDEVNRASKAYFLGQVIQSAIYAAVTIVPSSEEEYLLLNGDTRLVYGMTLKPQYQVRMSQSQTVENKWQP
jgi:hypothetical protein